MDELQFNWSKAQPRFKYTLRKPQVRAFCEDEATKFLNSLGMKFGAEKSPLPNEYVVEQPLDKVLDSMYSTEFMPGTHPSGVDTHIGQEGPWEITLRADPNGEHTRIVVQQIQGDILGVAEVDAVTYKQFLEWDEKEKRQYLKDHPTSKFGRQHSKGLTETKPRKDSGVEVEHQPPGTEVPKVPHAQKSEVFHPSSINPWQSRGEAEDAGNELFNKVPQSTKIVENFIRDYGNRWGFESKQDDLIRSLAESKNLLIELLHPLQEAVTKQPNLTPAQQKSLLNDVDSIFGETQMADPDIRESYIRGILGEGPAKEDPMKNPNYVGSPEHY